MCAVSDFGSPARAMSFDREELVRRVPSLGSCPLERKLSLRRPMQSGSCSFTQRSARAQWIGLLLDVLISFNELASGIVSAAELPEIGPSTLVPLVAARHTVAIADALTFFGGGAGGPAADLAEDELRTRWAETIIGLCDSEDSHPWHLSPNGYVGVTSGQLPSLVAALRANPTVALDPDDPAIAVMPLPSLEQRDDPDLAARRMAWCGASAICIAACLSPDFRLGLQPSRN